MQSLCEPCGTRVNEGFIDDFLRLIDEAAARMLVIEDEEASRPRAAGKWSRKEIVGHLIDSALNNHARFVRAMLESDLVFDGYDQDGWVRVQRYGEQGWPALVRAWRAYNRQIAEIMRSTPGSELTRSRQPHNLHEIAFQPLPADSVATLRYLMEDYVAHLQHHVRQVLELSGP